MADALENTAVVASELPEVHLKPRVTHLWVANSPFFETTIFVVGRENPKSLQLGLTVRDADGQLTNEARFEFPGSQVAIIPCEPLMAGCKLESGFAQAHVEIESTSAIKFWTRIQSSEGASFLAAPVIVSDVRRTFFPLLFQKDKTSLLCAVNQSAETATLRGKLFLGHRSPEMVWQVPGKGVRLFALNVDFEEYLGTTAGDYELGYLRLGVRGPQNVGVQLVERSPGMKEGNIFIAVS